MQTINIFTGMYEGKKTYQIETGGAYVTFEYDGKSESQDRFLERATDHFIGWIKKIRGSHDIKIVHGELKMGNLGKLTRDGVSVIPTGDLEKKMREKLSEINDPEFIVPGEN